MGQILVASDYRRYLEVQQKQVREFIQGSWIDLTRTPGKREVVAAISSERRNPTGESKWRPFQHGFPHVFTGGAEESQFQLRRAHSLGTGFVCEAKPEAGVGHTAILFLSSL